MLWVCGLIFTALMNRLFFLCWHPLGMLFSWPSTAYIPSIYHDTEVLDISHLSIFWVLLSSKPSYGLFPSLTLYGIADHIPHSFVMLKERRGWGLNCLPLSLEPNWNIIAQDHLATMAEWGRKKNLRKKEWKKLFKLKRNKKTLKSI